MILYGLETGITVQAAGSQMIKKIEIQSAGMKGPY